MNWKEWLVCLLVAPPVLIVGMVVFGMMVESFGEYQERTTNADHAFE